MNNKCQGIAGFVFGHCFVTAITKSAVENAPHLNCSQRFLTKVLDMHREEQYHGIYCKRCGKVISDA